MKKNATAKSSTPTMVRHKTKKVLARAVTRVTNPALLREIAKTYIKIEDLGFERHSGVNTIDLALAILNGRETNELVEWFMKANQEDEISRALGTVIAASRIAGRA